MFELSELRACAIDIFRRALQSVDVGRSVRRAVHLNRSQLDIGETTLNLATGRKIYSIAMGKAAHPMAAALDEILAGRLAAGLVAGPPAGQLSAAFASDVTAASTLPERWRIFAGGHPLPNEESLAAARAAFEILRRADEESALVLFLISGGGSALLEWPCDEGTTLAELRSTHRALVNSGASIAEINSVRRAISAVKGGRLAARAPHADQLSLIISDTNKGEESAVASGPTFELWPEAPDASAVIARYELAPQLPASILRVLAHPSPASGRPFGDSLRKHYVLLGNEDALAAASVAARALGFIVEVAPEIAEQEIGAGCTQLLERLQAVRSRAAATGPGGVVCLLSGGEFACPVRGRGLGGRNSETALRLALSIEERWSGERSRGFAPHIVALSAGTDGIDGNSPAAGALSDETTLERARNLGLDARKFLETSDAFSFFDALDDAIITGPTGTNVRDLRILLAG